MSDILNRSIRLGKAYADRVRDNIEDRLTDAEKNMAKDELDHSAGDEPGTYSRGYSQDNDPDALMRRAEERIAAVRRTADANLELAQARASREASQPQPNVMPTIQNATTEQTSNDPNAADYKLMGVAPGGDLLTVQAAYEKLTARCDPRRFPDGSAEQKQAEAILGRINIAYDNLRKRLDPTESRFGRLELE